MFWTGALIWFKQTKTNKSTEIEVKISFSKILSSLPNISKYYKRIFTILPCLSSLLQNHLLTNLVWNGFTYWCCLNTSGRLLQEVNWLPVPLTQVAIPLRHLHSKAPWKQNSGDPSSTSCLQILLIDYSHIWTSFHLEQQKRLVKLSCIQWKC